MTNNIPNAYVPEYVHPSIWKEQKNTAKKRLYKNLQAHVFFEHVKLCDDPEKAVTLNEKRECIMLVSLIYM